ncbi:hypothetical protein BBK82_35565 [Lentzea guizhouensis]|uniref:Carrier domain-containing protein n=1 Tax=Lentzea guizhouensis TaxID=1586287 RepID=A0A1B2HS28_9PSEU|nr:acyl carrier protein [Lentzea guizhouensis]ANZ40537.1 hypothetical protein BBK82_35565 [Lentzea guizhouensis]
MKPVQIHIREFVFRHLDGVEIDDDEDLFDGGHANSLFVVQLVLWLERTFGIALSGRDLDIDNFRTIGSIAAFVERKNVSAAVSGSV